MSDKLPRSRACKHVIRGILSLQGGGEVILIED